MTSNVLNKKNTKKIKITIPKKINIPIDISSPHLSDNYPIIQYSKEPLTTYQKIDQEDENMVDDKFNISPLIENQSFNKIKKEETLNITPHNSPIKILKNKIAKHPKNVRQPRINLKVNKVVELGYPSKISKQTKRNNKLYYIDIKYLDQNEILRKSRVKFGKGNEAKTNQTKIDEFKGDVKDPKFWEYFYLKESEDNRLPIYSKIRIDHGL